MLEALHISPKIHSSHCRPTHLTQQAAIATVQTDGVQTTVRPSRQRAWALICNGIFVTATVASAINVIAAKPVARERVEELLLKASYLICFIAAVPRHCSDQMCFGGGGPHTQ